MAPTGDTVDAVGLTFHHGIADGWNTKRQSTTSHTTTGDWRAVATDEGLVLESWSQGLIVGALLIMACITIANMRRGVLLHKLILMELLLAMSHGTFCFMSYSGYGWYLSSTAALLYISWIIHNIVAWLKVRPFFSHPGGFFRPSFSTWVSRIYLGSLILSVPVIVFQISDNFRYFNNRGGWYRSVRPYEPLMRDPWWVFTCIILFHVIRKCYGTGSIELVRRSPRFGILICSIFLSLVFTACDIAASGSSRAFRGATDGINPWWKLSLVFKCLTDAIMLDDFKTQLKRLGVKRIVREEKRRNTISLVSDRHPAAMEDSEDEKGSGRISRDRGSNQWFGRNSTVRTSTTADISPTTSAPNTNGKLDEHRQNHKTEPLNNPNATVEEIDFNTALFLDPPRLSGATSVQEAMNSEASTERRHNDRNLQNQERTSIAGHKKRIGHLPNLKKWRFEAIKPGRKETLSKSSKYQENRDQTIRKNNLTSTPTSLHLQDRIDEIDPLQIDIEAQQQNHIHIRDGGGGSIPNDTIHNDSHTTNVNDINSTDTNDINESNEPKNIKSTKPIANNEPKQMETEREKEREKTETVQSDIHRIRRFKQSIGA